MKRTLTSFQFLVIAGLAAIPAGAWSQEADRPVSPSPFAQVTEDVPVAAAPDFKRKSSTNQSPEGDGLGDHIARSVLNMNGLQITNLGEPFFDGDAVNLEYFNTNNGWDHVAKRDVDLSGFGLVNIGSIDLDGGELKNATLPGATVSGSTITNSILTDVDVEKSRLSFPMIDSADMTGGSISGAEMSDSDISATRLRDVIVEGAVVTGLEAEGARLDAAILSGGKIADSALTGVTSTNTTLSGLTRIEGVIEASEGLEFSGGLKVDTARIGHLSLEGPLSMSGKAITGLADADAPEDAMNMRSTRTMVEELVGEQVAGVEEATRNTARDAAIDAVGTAAPDWSEYRPTPPLSKSIGRLMGADATRAIGGITAMVYKLPDGSMALGVDPESIPPELRFVVRENENIGELGDYGIDYQQMIGPMLTAMQHLEDRIADLESRMD